MAVTINGTTGVSKVQDNTIDSSKIVAGSVDVSDLNYTPYRMVQETAVTASGTFVDFTGIPSWAKRITVMFSGVSTSGTSNIQIQIGSGSLINSGYVGYISNSAASVATSFSSGFVVSVGTTAADQQTLIASIFNTHGTSYIENSNGYDSASGGLRQGCGYLGLSGTLDRIRVTTVNGTDTFDAGTINIMWEG